MVTSLGCVTVHWIRVRAAEWSQVKKRRARYCNKTPSMFLECSLWVQGFEIFAGDKRTEKRIPNNVRSSDTLYDLNSVTRSSKRIGAVKQDVKAPDDTTEANVWHKSQLIEQTNISSLGQSQDVTGRQSASAHLFRTRDKSNFKAHGWRKTKLKRPRIFLRPIWKWVSQKKNWLPRE